MKETYQLELIHQKQMELYNLYLNKKISLKLYLSMIKPFDTAMNKTEMATLLHSSASGKAS